MIDLVIHMGEDRRVSVTGPIDDMLLCYGLLEIARDVIAARAQPAARRIIPASTLPPLNGRE
jgi:hypothetical protein